MTGSERPNRGDLPKDGRPRVRPGLFAAAGSEQRAELTPEMRRLALKRVALWGLGTGLVMAIILVLCVALLLAGLSGR